MLDVTNFLKDHPGDELALLTHAGKDAPVIAEVFPADAVAKADEERLFAITVEEQRQQEQIKQRGGVPLRR